MSKRWFLFVPTVIFPATFFYDAPFGRFSTPGSLLALDGIRSWIFMELISPMSFLLTAFLHPFSRTPLSVLSPQALLTALYLTHYVNRAVLSPLRTPSRAPSHPAVVVSAIFFNGPNGFLLAAYLTSTAAATFLANAYTHPCFWLGLILWAVGFAGNIIHDEILLNIRRKAKAKGKAKEKSQGEHYSIPHGLLYQYISYPNYFCEWVEWLGFALAASPLPDVGLLPAASAVLAALSSGSVSAVGGLFTPFADSVAPPWAFLAAEVLLMLPRAVRGHRWYLQRFGEAYPSGRRIVVPFLF